MFFDYGLLTTMDLTWIQKPAILVQSVIYFSPMNFKFIIMQPYGWVIAQPVR